MYIHTTPSSTPQHSSPFPTPHPLPQPTHKNHPIPLRIPTPRIIPTLHPQIIPRHGLAQPRILNKLNPIDAKPARHGLLVGRRDREVSRLLVQHEDVVVRVLRRLGGRRGPEVRRWTRGFGGEERAAVLAAAAGREVGEERVQDGAPGAAVVVGAVVVGTVSWSFLSFFVFGGFVEGVGGWGSGVNVRVDIWGVVSAGFIFSRHLSSLDSKAKELVIRTDHTQQILPRHILPLQPDGRDLLHAYIENTSAPLSPILPSSLTLPLLLSLFLSNFSFLGKSCCIIL